MLAAGAEVAEVTEAEGQHGGAEALSAAGAVASGTALAGDEEGEEQVDEHIVVGTMTRRPFPSF